MTTPSTLPSTLPSTYRNEPVRIKSEPRSDSGTPTQEEKDAVLPYQQSTISREVGRLIDCPELQIPDSLGIKSIRDLEYFDTTKDPNVVLGNINNINTTQACKLAKLVRLVREIGFRLEYVQGMIMDDIEKQLEERYETHTKVSVSNVANMRKLLQAGLSSVKFSGKPEDFPNLKKKIDAAAGAAGITLFHGGELTTDITKEENSALFYGLYHVLNGSEETAKRFVEGDSNRGDGIQVLREMTQFYEGKHGKREVQFVLLTELEDLRGEDSKKAFQTLSKLVQIYKRLEDTGIITADIAKMAKLIKILSDSGYDQGFIQLLLTGEHTFDSAMTETAIREARLRNQIQDREGSRDSRRADADADQMKEIKWPKGIKPIRGIDKSIAKVRCYACNKWGHIKANCPCPPDEKSDDEKKADQKSRTPNKKKEGISRRSKKKDEEIDSSESSYSSSEEEDNWETQTKKNTIDFKVRKNAKSKSSKN